MNFSKIAIIGGSNSVIKNGYTAHISNFLNMCGVDFDISNFAVGANYCLNGLNNLLNINVKEYGYFILDYFSNDYLFCMTYGTEAWFSAYEGLVRAIRIRNPGAHIICLLIGRRDAALATQEAMRARLESLATAYGVAVVDFDRYLRQSFKTEAEFKANYADGGHFKGPLTTDLVASMLAATIARQRARPNAGFDAFPPLSGNSLDDASSAQFDALVGDDHERVVFQNSRYQVRAVCLRAGETVELAVGQRPLAIGYVSAPTSCDLWFDNGQGQTLRLHTLHRRVQSGEFGFLLRTATLMQGAWKTPPKDGRIRVGAVRHTDTPAGTPAEVLSEYRMVPNDRADQQAVYLTTLLEA